MRLMTVSQTNFDRPTTPDLPRILTGLLLALLLVLAPLTPAWAHSHQSPSPAGAHIYLIEPQDGATLSSPVTVKFGLVGMGVAPSGVDVDNTGHHHLLVDVAQLPDLEAPLPTTSEILHFGAGQTETTLNLAPGEHTLRLVLGNYLHIPHDPPLVSEPVTIVVK